MLLGARISQAEGTVSAKVLRLGYAGFLFGTGEKTMGPE